MKLLIIGIVASGKTTLAKRLSKESNINYYQIDKIVHDDKNNYKRNNNEQQLIIDKINKNNNWIIEGTLRSNLYNLLELADKIIYLDIPLNIRKKRILIRYIKQVLKIEKCDYKPNIAMLKNMYKWTNEFEEKRFEFEENLFKYKEKLQIINITKKVNEFSLISNN